MSLLPRLLVVVLTASAGAALGARSGASAWTGAACGAAAGLASFAPAFVRRASTRAIAGAAAGAAAGLLLAVLLRGALPGYDDALPQPLVGATLALALAVAGASVGLERGALPTLRAPQPAKVVKSAEPERAPSSATKLVDTSVIIDGRIADVIAAGFLEGPVVVPQFVLKELQQVADSSDQLKRNRGRKGLDVLRAMQSSERLQVEFTSDDTPDVRDVDAKLLWLAERRGAKILTNDYNLNKVAQLRGIDVLNVNDLANAVRPVVLPGEALSIQVIKEGKERNQGVGYLDDGTMVVIENGRRLMGQKVDALVTSVIQTNAGKMIFATADDEPPEARPRVLRRTPEPALREAPVTTSPSVGES